MISTPERHRSRMRTSASAMSLRAVIWSRMRTSSLLSRCDSPGSRPSTSSCSIACDCSANLSTSDLMASGDAHTTLPCRRALSSFEYSRATSSALSS